jgi:hypothetical protein
LPGILPSPFRVDQNARIKVNATPADQAVRARFDGVPRQSHQFGVFRRIDAGLPDFVAALCSFVAKGPSKSRAAKRVRAAIEQSWILRGTLQRSEGGGKPSAKSR